MFFGITWFYMGGSRENIGNVPSDMIWVPRFELICGCGDGCWILGGIEKTGLDGIGWMEIVIRLVVGVIVPSSRIIGRSVFRGITYCVSKNRISFKLGQRTGGDMDRLIDRFGVTSFCLCPDPRDLFTYRNAQSQI